MRCPDCNKFVAQEVQDPEIELQEDIETSPEGADVPYARFDASARIVVACADCGTELKEASFEFDGEFDQDVVDDHAEEGEHSLSMEVQDEEATERSEGKGRSWTKHFYGVRFSVALLCSCQKEPVFRETFDDEVPASGMDELV